MKSPRTMLVGAVSNASAEDIVAAMEDLGALLCDVDHKLDKTGLAVELRYVTSVRLSKVADDLQAMLWTHRYGTTDPARIEGARINCMGCMTCAQLTNQLNKALATSTRAHKRFSQACKDRKALDENAKLRIAQKDVAE
jgi:hypothetical protein